MRIQHEQYPEVREQLFRVAMKGFIHLGLQYSPCDSTKIIPGMGTEAREETESV